jgi:CBS domain containing-hemolysin-like protein
MSILASIALGVLVVLLITALTGWFVAQEFAFLAVDRTRLAARAEGTGRDADRARGVLSVTRRTSFMLSGAQLGITVTGLLVGYVAEPLIGTALGDALDGAVSRGVAMAIGGTLALAFSTIVQMLFGELYPKNYAIAEPERSSNALAPSTRLYLTAFGPLIWVFDRAAERLLRLFGQEPVHDVEQAASAADLAHVVSESAEQGELDEDLADVIDRILDFPERDAEHAMRPRRQVAVVRAATPIGEVRERMALEHTRYPVLDDDDRILGIAHLVDLLAVPPGSPEALLPVSTLMREPLVLSDVTSLPVAAEQMQGRSRLACVVDEFGTFTGIVTLEDIAEEIVGEIEDEHDGAPDHDSRRLADGSWELPANLHLDEVGDLLGVDLPQGEKETMGGFVIEHAGRLVEVGDVVEVDLPVDADGLVAFGRAPREWVELSVLDIEDYVPARVRIRHHVAGEGEAEER